MNKFSTKLKNLRNEKKLTQKDVADILKISRTTYAGYEQNYREPDFETLKKICTFFNISIDELLENEPTMFDNSKNIELNHKEIQLIQKYNQLNKRKQNLVDSYIDTMLEFEKEEQQRSKKYGE